MFQSTHAHGVRPMIVTGYDDINGFNPRTHMACDMKKLRTLLNLIVSIHARTWRAT